MTMPHPDLRRVRLLVAEDEWLILDRIERALDGSRYAIVAKAPSLQHALRLADEATFDAAVLDGNLDGQLTAALATRLRAIRIPVLMLTAYAGSTRPPLPAGAPMLMKPFSGEALVSALDRLIGDHSPLDHRPNAG